MLNRNKNHLNFLNKILCLDNFSYVSYFLCCRANNLLSYLLERETIREDYSRKKKDNLSESIQELKNP